MLFVFLFCSCWRSALVITQHRGWRWRRWKSPNSYWSCFVLVEEAGWWWHNCTVDYGDGGAVDATTAAIVCFCCAGTATVDATTAAIVCFCCAGTAVLGAATATINCFCCAGTAILGAATATINCFCCAGTVAVDATTAAIVCFCWADTADSTLLFLQLLLLLQLLLQFLLLKKNSLLLHFGVPKPSSLVSKPDRKIRRLTLTRITLAIMIPMTLKQWDNDKETV